MLHCSRNAAISRQIDPGGRTPIQTAVVRPIDKAALVLHELLVKAGLKPKVMRKYFEGEAVATP